ncbi:MAG: class I SAM-dependent methyltransferase family protein [archaeon]
MPQKLALKIALREAEKIRLFLLSNNLLDTAFELNKDKTNIYFPLSSLPKGKKQELRKKFPNAVFVKAGFRSRNLKPRSLKDALKGKLTGEEFNSFISSYDTVGTIAILEIPEELEKKEKLIAETLLDLHHNIKTVCKITGSHQGPYRIQPVEILAGRKTTETLHKEKGCLFKTDVSKAFFSPRLSHERERIAKLIKNGEIIGAFFAGVGPYPIIFAKHSKMKKAYAIELNKTAVKYMKENISLNNVEGKVEAILGDVNNEAKKFPNFFDRIVMPLPRDAEHFLDAALFSIKSGGVIHFYQFVDKDDPYSLPLKRIMESAEKFKKKVKILRKAEVRSFSASKIQVVVDFEVLHF